MKKSFTLFLALMAGILTCINQRAYAYDDYLTIDFFFIDTPSSDYDGTNLSGAEPLEESHGNHY